MGGGPAGCLLAACFAAATCAEPVQGGAPPGLLAGFDFDRPAVHYPFPRHLREPSGLAWIGGGRVLTHDDNVSTLYETRYLTQSLPERIGGAAFVKGDFEGVAVLDGTIYLMTSHGSLYRVPGSTEPGATTTLEPVSTGLEGRCNFEGLTARSAERDLVLACKHIHGPSVEGAVQLYRFDLEAGVADGPMVVDIAEVLTRYRLKRLRPSGIEWLPAGGRLLLLAGKERVLLELDDAWQVRATARLSRRYHRQAEGIAVDDEGRLIIADEGSGLRRATLTLYRPRLPDGSASNLATCLIGDSGYSAIISPTPP